MFLNNFLKLLFIHWNTHTHTHFSPSMCPHTYFDSGHLMCKSSHYHKHTIYKFGKLDFITWPPQRVSQVHTHSVLALYMWKQNLIKHQTYSYIAEIFSFTLRLLLIYHMDYCYRNVTRSIKWKKGVFSPCSQFTTWRISRFLYYLITNSCNKMLSQYLRQWNIFSLIWPDVATRNLGKPWPAGKPLVCATGQQICKSERCLAVLYLQIQNYSLWSNPW